MRAIDAGLFAAMFLLVSHAQGDAHAYLDPGTGSVALQLLLAGVVGGLATVRLYWDRVKTLIRGKGVAGDGPQGH